MKYLLDTHTLIWTLLDPEKLSKVARQLIESKKNEIYVSSVSFWEIALKSSIGKLEFEDLENIKIPGYIEKMGIGMIELNSKEAIESGALPFHGTHKDPFDRILIWQAISRKLHLISKDEKMREYEVDGLKHSW